MLDKQLLIQEVCKIRVSFIFIRVQEQTSKFCVIGCMKINRRKTRFWKCGPFPVTGRETCLITKAHQQHVIARCIEKHRERWLLIPAPVFTFLFRCTKYLFHVYRV